MGAHVTVVASANNLMRMGRPRLVVAFSFAVQIQLGGLSNLI